MLTISNSAIGMKDGLYSLNDLHRASGSNKKHKPANFMRIENTRSLITEIERCSDMSNGTKSMATKSLKVVTQSSKVLLYAVSLFIAMQCGLAHAFN